jgi:putative endonuclease
MFYYVYVLRSLKDGSLHVGYTINIEKRLKEHNQGLFFDEKQDPLELHLLRGMP